MTKFIRVDWPEIQNFMTYKDYKEQTYFDPIKNVWFVPDFWYEQEEWDDWNDD